MFLVAAVGRSVAERMILLGKVCNYWRRDRRIESIESLPHVRYPRYREFQPNDRYKQLAERFKSELQLGADEAIKINFSSLFCDTLFNNPCIMTEHGLLRVLLRIAVVLYYVAS